VGNVGRNFKLEVPDIQQVVLSVVVADLNFYFVDSHVPEKGGEVKLLHSIFIKRNSIMNLVPLRDFTRPILSC
jgi:hypothetical protein